MKILMVTASFDIGGAETHILELCRALSKKGVTVAVASAGGEYVKELNIRGIPHYKINLSSKNPYVLASSYRKLKKLISDKKFDVVHSHARLSSLLCENICSTLSIPFVTTAHWVFSLAPLKKRFSRWGNYTLAVSEDIKNYLSENYKIKAENISVTKNGIDTTTFSKKSLNTDNKTRIYCVSRIDKGRAATAFSLVKITPYIYKKHKDVEIIIIGEGDQYTELQNEAKKSNEKCNETIVKLLGKRTDIQNCLQDCDIFVGVSRAALEAMSCECPVVLSGDEGYSGIFTPKNANKEILSNFCCRGEAKLSDATLLNDLLSLLSLEKEELIEKGKQNRDFILKNYSSEKMADDAIEIYKKALQPNVIICGYYGYGNTGDELTLKNAVRILKNANISNVTVMSSKPKEAKNNYKTNSIYRYNPWQIARSLRKSNIFLLGGGNLLQNQTSNRSLLYYGLLLKIAKRYNNKCILFSSGIGELKGKWAKEFAHEVLSLCEGIFSRTENDLIRLKNIEIFNKVFLSSDLVFLESTTNTSKLQKEKYFLITIREPKAERNKLINKLTKEINDFCIKSGLYPLFISMHQKKDEKITFDVAKKCKNSKVLRNVSLDEFEKLLENAEFSIGMRLHTMVLSLALLTPHILIPYDTKCLDMYYNVLRVSREIGIDSDDFIICKSDIADATKILIFDKPQTQIKMQKVVEKLRFETDNFKNYIENLFYM